ncbi:hypothetical protein BASA50_007045 [Batrachochytrium salamandrivorans]|uniref:ER membrane protein complex subunit 6 n=1 Tax=Batrachochytrium salamandrivorans TaxID=1357716 RepID=A0ABQ8F8G3_9FUNG|nr:hypothetical protein BASA60_006648 [Batrachochytrium salamandrivorans]KAH6575975.1 hypothetical protein BASA62_001684 [Batrachochytrium salamandrivorans]KAH6588110.1 hypothetical protein BASA61_006110 [Batrachochytrium salamandrivorans]KAH6593819.1 hypothetical protein BASA50_007045 [Batrachochytrium salamandrivorans]KAH9252301.1 hypothetical protein BASA81_009754 [Batrachochytrium salamandrivorans]
MAQQGQQQEVEQAPQLSGDCLKYNFKSIDYARSSLALFSGAAAGILGLQGLYGFLFYLVVSLGMSLSYYFYTTGMKPAVYLPTSAQVWTQGVFTNLSSYVLFWTLAFGLVHVYE